MRKLFSLFAAMLVALAVNATILDIGPTSPQSGDNIRREIRDHINAGDTLRLADGTYTESEIIALSKSVVILAAEDAHPVIKHQYYATLTGENTKVVIKGVKFDGSLYPSNDHCIRPFDAAAGKSLTLEDCEFTGYPSYIIYPQRGDRCIDELIIKNCYFHDNARCAIWAGYDSSHGTNVSLLSLDIQNSTFANFTNVQEALIAIKNAGSETADQEVKIDHCTFYNYVKSSEGTYTFVDVRKSTDVAISNCIFAQPTANMSGATYVYGGSIDNCLIYNTTGHRSSSIVHNGITGDPLFVNAAEGNLTLGEGSPALGAGTESSNLGDPRWWPAPKTIYCKVTADWWNWDYSNKTAVAAYAWNGTHSAVKNAEWPGVKMTEVENENGVWSIELDAKYTQIIFTRILPNGIYKGVKTYDLTVPTNDNNMYTITRETFDWSSEQLAESDGAWGVFTPTVLEDITYYFVNNPEWGEVHAYAWDPVIAAWPGETATLVDGVTVNGYNVYSYTMKSNRLHIIFNDGTGGEGHQTANLDVEDGKPYFYKGTWYASASAIPANTLENGYYLVGDFADVPAWGVADLTAAKKFSVNPDNAAEYMLANVTLAADDSLKVAKVKDDEILSYAPTEANYVVDAAHAGVKTIYYRPAADGGEGWWYNCIYVPKNDGTALDNTAVADKAQKFMENGQLFIRRDGKIYTTTGVQVK